MGRHCDDYIDDASQPECLRKFLDHARSPAHGSLRPDRAPKLFARHNGRLVRVVMASRFGDVGITTRLHNDHGYEKRVMVADLTAFADRKDRFTASPDEAPSTSGPVGMGSEQENNRGS